MAEKEIQKEIAVVRADITKEEAAQKEWMDMVNELQPVIDAGNVAPKTQLLYESCTSGLAQANATLDGLRKKLQDLEVKLPNKSVDATPKYDVEKDMEKHPLNRKTMAKAEPMKPVTFNTGDFCEVQWSDKAWYKAKVLSVMGSSADPKYTVRFTQYDDTATVDRKSIRPLASETRKRKTEELPVAVQPTAQAQIVISGPAKLNPAVQAAAQNDAAGGTADRPKKRHKIGGNKILNDKKNNWKAFQANNTAVKQESQFRVGAGINSKVGITGSGAGMTKAVTRVRATKVSADMEDEDGDTGSSAKTPRGGDRDHGRSNWRPAHSRY